MEIVPTGKALGAEIRGVDILKIQADEFESIYRAWFDHQVLLSILREKILGQRFLRLIQTLLQAGYLEDWHYHTTLSGTPQGAIVSPLLSNLYLDKLDTLNLSHFVARKIWRRRGVSPLRCRAHRLQIQEPLRGLLVPMDTTFDLLQTAIN